LGLGHDELWKKSACNHQSLIRTETEETASLSGLKGSVPLMMQAPSNSGIPIWRTPHSLSALRTKENKMSSSRLVELLKIKGFFLSTPLQFSEFGENFVTMRLFENPTL
jgi:hypothetical protein